MKDLRVYCADVGSIRRGNFAWVRRSAAGGRPKVSTSIETLAEDVSRDLNAERPIALGFECPLSIPIPEESGDLGRAREFERDRPWSSGAGVATLGTGLAQLVWVMNRVKALRGPGEVPITLEWGTFLSISGARLLLWEAFVTKSGKPAKRRGQTEHEADARLAVDTFLRQARAGRPGDGGFGAGTNAPEQLVLIGAAALWSGLSNDVSLLRKDRMVGVQTNGR